MKILTIEDVFDFFREMQAYNIGFTPGINFHHCTNRYTGYKIFNRFEASRLNRLLAQCFEVSHHEGRCIYEIGLAVLYEEHARKREEIAKQAEAY